MLERLPPLERSKKSANTVPTHKNNQIVVTAKNVTDKSLTMTQLLSNSSIMSINLGSDSDLGELPFQRIDDIYVSLRPLSLHECTSLGGMDSARQNYIDALIVI